MKKFFIIIFILLFIFLNISFAGKNKSKGDQKTSPPPDTVTKTYFLKNISPKEVRNALRHYFWESSYLESKRMITVIIPKKNITQFESLLKKIDVEKKTITFRIFTVIASQKPNGGKIENKNLKYVLSQLDKILSFKSYKLDGVSLITVKEGTKYSRVHLSSSIEELRVEMMNVYINTHKPGDRSIEIRELRLREQKFNLISTQTSIKENGYLVAGVSKMGKNGDSLVLIINAEIK